MDVQINCAWCQVNDENDMHVLFMCVFAKEVWTQIGIAGVVQPLPSDIVLTLRKRVFQNGSKERNSLVSMICWNLWHRRNNWVWNHISGSSFGLQSRARNMLQEWTRAQEERIKQMGAQHGINRSWERPPEGWIKSTQMLCVNSKMEGWGWGVLSGTVWDDSLELVVRRYRAMGSHGKQRQ